MNAYIIALLLKKLLKGWRRNTTMLAVGGLLAVTAVLLVRNGLPKSIQPLRNKIAAVQPSSHKETNNTDPGTFDFKPGYPDTKVKGLKTLTRKGYVCAYCPVTRQPYWVAWRLTAEHTKGNARRDGLEFTEDTSVDSPRADTYDYIQSGYDRGHMCPAADNKWSSKAMEESFLMTNICPQHPELNRGDWNDIEQQCRIWARRYGKVYIVCGPIFLRGNHRKIGKHRIPVPDAFFKVILRTTPAVRGIGFICRNTGGHRRKDFYVNSIKEVERITGINFFPQLSDREAAAAKGNSSLRHWRLTLTRKRQ